jgi:hypothetical protein
MSLYEPSTVTWPSKVRERLFVLRNVSLCLNKECITVTSIAFYSAANRSNPRGNKKHHNIAVQAIHTPAVALIFAVLITHLSRVNVVQ